MKRKKNTSTIAKNFWVKQIVVWLMILAISLSFAKEAQASSKEKYKQMAGEEKFTEIQKQVTYSALNMSNYKASDAYQEIADALNDFRQLQTLVRKATYVDDVIDEVTDRLDRIATTYDNVVSFGQSMKQYRKGEFSYLKDINGETLKTQQELKKRITTLESENRLFQKKLSSATDEIELKELEIRLKGNKSVINSLEAQCMIWDKFYLAQNQLLESLDLNRRKINLLLQILEVNARVYHEAATVAHLRRSAKSALESLGALADIQSIIGELQDSWLQIDTIVSEIGKANFSIEI
jgi:hypothetical protein